MRSCLLEKREFLRIDIADSMKSSIYIFALQSHTNGKLPCEWQQKIVEGKKMHPVG